MSKVPCGLPTEAVVVRIECELDIMLNPDLPKRDDWMNMFAVTIVGFNAYDEQIARLRVFVDNEKGKFYPRIDQTDIETEKREMLLQHLPALSDYISHCSTKMKRLVDPLP